MNTYYMKLRLVCLGVFSLGLLANFAVRAQAPQSSSAHQPPGNNTIKVTSTLVFLDVTVLDKKGRPVTSGLT